MLRYIENLRKKPEAARKVIAASFAAAFLLAIFSYWLYALPGKIGGEDGENGPQGSSSPFELINDATRSAYQGFEGAVDSAQNAWPFLKK